MSSARSQLPEDTEEDAAESRMIIEACIARGLDDEQIAEILKQHKHRKMQARMKEQRARMKEHLRPASSASRCSESKRSEISAAAQSHVMDAAPSYGILADKRAKSKETSVAMIGSFDFRKSQADYIEAQQQAAAARNRNNTGAGIFDS